MHKSYSSKKQQPIHVYNTHFRYIDSNTPIKKLFRVAKISLLYI